MNKPLHASIALFCLYGILVSFIYGNKFLILPATFGVFAFLAEFKGGVFVTLLKILAALNTLGFTIIIFFHYWFEPKIAAAGSEAYAFYEAAEEKRFTLACVIPLVFFLYILILLLHRKKQA